MSDSTKTLQEQLEALKAENEALKARNALDIRIAEKTGGISVYGLQRFPVTLKPNQWDRIVAAVDQLKTFVDENRDRCEAIISGNEAIREAEKAAERAEREATKAQTKAEKKGATNTRVLTAADPRVQAYQAAIKALVENGVDRDKAIAMVPFPSA